MDPSMPMERRGLAQGLKTFVGVLILLVFLSGGLMALWLPASALLGGRGDFLSVPVAVGDGSLLSVVSLDVEGTSLPNATEFRLVKGRGELRFRTSDPVYLLGHAGAMVISLSVILVGLVLLRQVLAATAAGTPFHPANPRRLHLLGLVILAGSVGGSVLEFLSARWILTRIQVESPPLSPPIHVPGGWIFCGLLVLVLAAVWKEAVEIARDQSLTV